MLAFERLDWDDLRFFLHAARAGSLARASMRLKVDQSTVSRRLVQLESALELTVFERHRTGLKLTENGEKLLSHAAKVESAIIGIREEFYAEEAAVTGSVRLATMEGIASLYLAERFGELRRTSPHLTVELVTSAQTVYVARREADLFMSFFAPPGRGLVSERIGGFELGLYASEDYLARHGTPTSRQDLDQHLFATYIDDLIQVDTVKWLDEVIEDPEVTFRSNSMIAQISAAAGGLGMVLLPSFAATMRPDLVPVLHGAVSTRRDIWLSTHNDLQYSPRIRTVTTFLKALFQNDPAMQAL
ncbi:LysR family transcriptional regulator [Rhodobium gokarnense]|uniref:DNA-binding transcriptional LysR family regulator n=1 Tax=Rhodobium gokarnense TaxID=364296 RepID=A0ABT3H917_9HYPH|nr:LysR family transcriptional regulator [Rhodobium gokarnense]MCW2306892.1 DNA-binding transcriptional LysR family regulator [Rhodobium gokarnense]